MGDRARRLPAGGSRLPRGSEPCAPRRGSHGRGGPEVSGGCGPGRGPSLRWLAASAGPGPGLRPRGGRRGAGCWATQCGRRKGRNVAGRVWLSRAQGAVGFSWGRRAPSRDGGPSPSAGTHWDLSSPAAAERGAKDTFWNRIPGALGSGRLPAGEGARCAHVCPRGAGAGVQGGREGDAGFPDTGWHAGSPSVRLSKEPRQMPGGALQPVSRLG